MKRKLFVAALVLILALAMLPSFALADGPLDQLKADIAAAPTNGAETRVELTGNITDFLFQSDDTVILKEQKCSCFICCIVRNCDRITFC